jgi:hypothetical protein
MELAQLGAGIHAQLAGNGPPGLLVNLKRLSVPPSTFERPHEQQPQAFAQRMVGDEPAEFGRGLGVPSAGDLRLGAELLSVEAEISQPFGLRFDQRRRRDVGQRPAVPQAERLGQLAGGPLRIAGRERPPAVAEHGLEQQRVGIGRGHAELVAGGAGDEQAAVGTVHEPAQPQHVDADEIGRLSRRIILPHLVDQGVGGDDLSRIDQQSSQDGAPLGRSDALPVVSGPDLKRSEQPEPHHYLRSLASGYAELAIRRST